MRNDILKLAGALAVLLAVLYVAEFAIDISSGVNIYEDDAVDVLPDIHDNEAMFVGAALLDSVSTLLLAPVLLGLFFTVKREDRPYFSLPVAFLAIAGMLFIVGNAMEIALADVAGNYVDATGATKDALLQDGDTLLSVSLVTGGTAFVPYALGMLLSGVLMLRSAFFPKWIAWPTIIIGGLGLIAFVSFVFVLPGRVLWLLASGITMLRKSGGASQPSPATAQTSPAAA